MSILPRRAVALVAGVVLLPAAALLAAGELAGAATEPTASFTKASTWDTGYG